MELLLAYNPFSSYGGSHKADGSSTRAEVLGGNSDLSKRNKRLKPVGSSAKLDSDNTVGPSPLSVNAYSTSTSTSHLLQQAFSEATHSSSGTNSSRSSSTSSPGGVGTTPDLLSGSLMPSSGGTHPFVNGGSSNGGSSSGSGSGGAASAGMFAGPAATAAAAAAAGVPRFNVAGAAFSTSLPRYSSGMKKGVNSVLVDMTTMCKRLWLLAWPLSWMEVLTFTKELIITSYVGHLGAPELSALVLAQTVYNVTGNAPMLGFVTAMETFCGQAFGARRFGLVGVVLQRGLAISFLYCCGALVMWNWCEAALVYMGQDVNISASAAKFTLALAPALFMDAADQCCRRYLSSQAVVQPLMLVTLAATLLTPLYLWIFVARFGMGLLGAAVAWDLVQATSLALMVTCVVVHTRSQEASKCTWPGWTVEAFSDWSTYIRMAIPSCVMICLDWWTFEVIVMLSGLLPNPEQTMSMMGITFNIHALCFFAAHGLSGAASTRVGNDLGAGRPHMAWLTVQVAVLMGTLVMIISSCMLLLGRNHLGTLFSSEHHVVMLTAQAVPPLAVSLVGEGANTVLAGVMRGCGRQKIGATINLVTYWVFGLPIACLLAFPGKLGALGLWTGLACTASIQALLMTLTVFKFNWADEATRAKQLVAAGELVLEEEEPFDLGDDSETYNDTYNCSSYGTESDKEGVLGGQVGRRSSARPDKGSNFQIKAGSPELGRLLP